jgi:hypothetical protein
MTSPRKRRPFGTPRARLHQRLIRRGASPDLLDLIEQLGWPLTKAGYVAAMYDTENPVFPLDAEILARVPRGLPGRMPRFATDLLFPILRAPRDWTPDRVLVEQVMLRHGLTREEAIQELLRVL